MADKKRNTVADATVSSDAKITLNPEDESDIKIIRKKVTATDDEVTTLRVAVAGLTQMVKELKGMLVTLVTSLPSNVAAAPLEYTNDMINELCATMLTRQNLLLLLEKFEFMKEIR